MTMVAKRIWLGMGTVLAAFGASLCCILPVAVAVLGIGSAALGAKLEPLRPYLVGLTLVFWGVAFYQVYKPAETECAPGKSCAVPANRRRQRLLLWVVAGVALALITFPYYANWLLE